MTPNGSSLQPVDGWFAGMSLPPKGGQGCVATIQIVARLYALYGLYGLVAVDIGMGVRQDDVDGR